MSAFWGTAGEAGDMPETTRMTLNGHAAWIKTKSPASVAVQRERSDN
jgi:hypothetical protein